MSLQTICNRIVKEALIELYLKLPFEGIKCPIFILGCGRSGTSIFGTALSQHKKITYLNEPRDLWFSAYPETDIWTSNASARKGRLFLTDADVDSKKSQRIKRLFRLEIIKSKRPILVEKLPINNFRLKLIRKIFPDARFIHIYRNGLEVARSIQKACEDVSWFGENSYKWDRIVEYASSKDDTSALPALCSNFFDKGLLEWRLSTEAAVEFLRDIPCAAFFEFSYADLVENPVETMFEIFRFIGIEDDQKVKDFVLNNINRKSSKLVPSALSEKERIIGGKLLPLSFHGGKVLTKHCK